MKRLAIIFPGIGYHKDKPLLYYSTKMVKARGFEIKSIEYHDMPGKIQGDAQMMRQAVEIGYKQAEELLAGMDFEAYEEIILIGKSIGTVIASRFAGEHKLNCRQVWYTPVEATFDYYEGIGCANDLIVGCAGDSIAGRANDSINADNNVIAFIGDNDPWSNLDAVKERAANKKIPLHLYKDCNHSLECGDAIRDIETLADVMKKTMTFLEK